MKDMKKEIIIEVLNDGHPAKAHGFQYSASVYVDNVYCGNGKFFKTREEAEAYKESEEKAKDKRFILAFIDDKNHMYTKDGFSSGEDALNWVNEEKLVGDDITPLIISEMTPDMSKVSDMVEALDEKEAKLILTMYVYSNLKRLYG